MRKDIRVLKETPLPVNRLMFYDKRWSYGADRKRMKK